MSHKYHILSKEEREIATQKRKEYMKPYMDKYNKRRKVLNSDLTGYIFTLKECDELLNKPNFNFENK